MEQEKSGKGLVVFLVSVIVILLVVVGFLAGIFIGSKDSDVKDNKAPKQEERIDKKDQKEDKNDAKASDLTYNLEFTYKGVKNSITIDKDRNVVVKEEKNGKETNSFKVQLDKKAYSTLNDYFESFADEDESAAAELIQKKNGVYVMSINGDESKEYQEIVKKSEISSEDKGYDVYISVEVFTSLKKALENIHNGSKDQEQEIIMALQQF